MDATQQILKPTESRQNSLWNFYEDGVTQSLISNFLLCPEKHRLKYNEGWQGSYHRDAMAIGTIVHSVLEAAYTRRRDDATFSLTDTKPLINDMIERMHEADRKEQIDVGTGTAESLESLSQVYGIARCMVEHYFCQWPGDFNKKEWALLEETFDVPLTTLAGSQTRLRGKIDGAYRDGNGKPDADGNAGKGKLWLFETKTKARIEDEAIAEKLPFDLQIGMYSMVMQALMGEQPAGVLYNLIRRPQLRKTQKETGDDFLERIREDIHKRPDFYYIRYEAAISKEDVQRWLQDFFYILDQLERHYLGEFNYRNVTSCTDKFGTCEYLPVCSRQDYFGLKKKTELFPELAVING